MELQRAIDSLLKWMHRYVSPVFLALLMASFILWYIAKLSYIYTTEQKVRVDVDGQVFDVTCTVGGHEGRIIIDPQSLQNAISVKFSDIKITSIDAVPEIDFPDGKE